MPGISASKIGIPFQKNAFSFSSYWTTRHPELATYIDGLTTPLSTAQIRRLGEFIEAVKTGLSITNLSDAFDVMYVLAGETAESSLKNLVKNAHHCTAVNSPTFAALEGFTSNGSSSYINTNYNATSDKDNFAQDDASIGCYSRTNQWSLTLNSVECGATPNPSVGLSYKWGVTNFRNVNSNDSAENVAMTSTLGMFIGTRPNSITEIFYQNKGIDYQETNKASTGIPNKNIVILCTNVGNAVTTTPLYYSTKQISFFFQGKCLTQLQADALTDAFEVYMDANGKGVIA